MINDKVELRSQLFFECNDVHTNISCGKWSAKARYDRFPSMIVHCMQRPANYSTQSSTTTAQCNGHLLDRTRKDCGHDLLQQLSYMRRIYSNYRFNEIS